MNDLLTTNRVSELLQVDRTTVYCLLKNGRLPGVKVGNQWRFPRQACHASWRNLAHEAANAPTFATCHAGLQYAHACIDVVGTPPAMLIAGQFYSTSPDPDQESARIQQLAQKHNLDLPALQEAAAQITCLDERKRSDITHWLEKAAKTFAEAGRKRAEMFDRLRRIVEISSIN